MFPNGRATRPAAVRLKLVVLAALVLSLLLAIYPLGRYIWASVHYQRALSAIERRDFSEAQRHLAICMKEWPNSAQTRFLGTHTARRAGELKEAQRLLKDSERLGWVPEAIELERGLLSVRFGGFQAIHQPLMELVRQEHPDSLLIVEVLAPLAMQEFDAVLASECLDYWTRLDPSNPQPHLWRGDVLLRLLQKNEALGSYRRAVALGPNDAEARLRCGELLLDRRLFAEAREHFQWLMERKPTDAAVRRGMANCLLNSGETDRARRLLVDLLHEQPDDAAAMLVLGQLELGADNQRDAEKWLQQAVDRAPFDPVALYNLSVCLAGKPAEAEKVRQRMKNVNDALDESRELLRKIGQTPGDPEPRRQLAIRLKNNGQVGEAIRWLETGLRIDPNHADSYDTLAECYGRLGDTKRQEGFKQRADEIRKMPPR